MQKATLIFLSSFVLAVSQAVAGSAYCSKPVRVAMFEFGVLYRSSTGEGTDSQLLDVLQRRTGCTFERVLMPRARIWQELQGGSLDMATAAIPTEERRTFGYLLPYMTTRNLVLIRKSVGQLPNSLEAIAHSDLRVAAVRGFRHEPAYDALLGRLVQQGQLKEVVDVAELLKFLERGVVDVVFSQPIVFREYLDNKYLENELAIRDWAPREQSSVGTLILSRTSFTPEQAQRWDRLIAEILREGTMYKIFRKFVSPREARELIYTGSRDPK